MKKMYLLLGAVIFATTMVNAQTPLDKEKEQIKRAEPADGVPYTSEDRAPGDVFITDDFSDMDNWSVYTESGTTPLWEFADVTPPDLATYIGEMESPSNENGFAFFNGVTFLLAGEVDPIDALLEYDPVIDCSDKPNVLVEFFAAYRAFNADEIFLEVTSDGWDSFEAYELFPDLITNAPAVQEFVVVDITAVAGGEENVKIRFRFTELDGDDTFGAGYGLLIDDFGAKEPWAYDLELMQTQHRSGITVLHENGLDYYFIPQNQVEDISFSGMARNFGSETQTGSKLNVSVTGPESFSGASTPIDFPSGAIDNFELTTAFAPSTPGIYNIEYWMDGDILDEFTGNDTLTSEPITITDEEMGFAYGRDNGIPTSSIGNVTSNIGAPLKIGNQMRIVSTDFISSVEIRITDDATNVGQLIFAEIRVYEDGDYIYLDQTLDHEITADDLGTFVTIYFEDNIPLVAGEEILLLAGHYGGADEPRFQLAQQVEFATVLGYTAGSTDPFALTEPSAVMIRANMEEADFITDTDGDGIVDLLELSTDTDGDGIDNFMDPDDDGDGIPTIDESGDTDGDGVDDYLDTDDDGDGIPTEEEEEGDSDGDGVDDYLDNDDDGDGVLTIDEVDGDSDDDGIDDYLDDDDDNDGIPTLDEEDTDTDGDGIDNYLDTDDDGDGILTIDEEDTDTDGDGIDNYLDNDDDGDGILTEDELDEDEDGEYDDSDGDGLVDYLDEENFIGIDPNESTTLWIGQNTPNPFDEVTTIPYELMQAAHVSVIVCDISGKNVIERVEGKQAAGAYSISIDRNQLKAGVYFYTFIIDGQKLTKKMVVN